MTPVSIIICTKNRSESLRQTLVALANLAVPSDLTAELILIDNGSTDATAEVVAKANCGKVSVKYFLEPHGGKCNGLNRALKESKGEVLLITDDDIRPCVDWLEGMCRPILEGSADAVAGGVTIAPYLERPWLRGDLRGWVGCSDKAVDVNVPGHAVGANISFSRKVLTKVPWFDPETGPGALGFYDDAIFWRQIVAAGYRIVGRPSVIVEHHFDQSRLNRKGFLAIAKRLGNSLAYVTYHWEQTPIRFLLLKQMYYRGLLALWRLLVIAPSGDRETPRNREIQLEFAIALVSQYARERRLPRKYERHGLIKLVGVQ